MQIGLLAANLQANKLPTKPHSSPPSSIRPGPAKCFELNTDELLHVSLWASTFVYLLHTYALVTYSQCVLIAYVAFQMLVASDNSVC